jgi:fructosamine-3-kinase
MSKFFFLAHLAKNILRFYWFCKRLYSYDFYVAYENVWPLDSGYKARKNLYNLYHILNHLNLFGSGYLHQAEAMMQTLIVQVK